MLINQIKMDSVNARKAKNTISAALLVTLFSEASMVGKNDGNRESTDEEVIKVVEKFVKSATQVKDVLIKANKDTKKVDVELNLLSVYLPSKMSEEKLENVIKDIISDLPDKSLKQMGKIMSTLKEKFNGQYDGQVASNIVKGLLK